jgi:hypothetical protein
MKRCDLYRVYKGSKYDKIEEVNDALRVALAV